MQKVLLLVLKKRACSCMDNGFGKPSRAAGVEDVQRVRGRELLEDKRFIRGP